MCVNGADKRRFPQKSLYDGCRGCLTRPSFALSLGGSRAVHITALDPESMAAVYPGYNRKENPRHGGTEMS
jgi:hypothetical protein